MLILVAISTSVASIQKQYQGLYPLFFTIVLFTKWQGTKMLKTINFLWIMLEPVFLIQSSLFWGNHTVTCISWITNVLYLVARHGSIYLFLSKCYFLIEISLESYFMDSIASIILWIVRIFTKQLFRRTAVESCLKRHMFAGWTKYKLIAWCNILLIALHDNILYFCNNCHTCQRPLLEFHTKTLI